MPDDLHATTTITDADKPLVLGAFLPYRFSVVAECISRAFAQRYEEAFGLTIPEWRVMAVLGEQGRAETQDVIRLTEMDRVKVSRAVIRLADKGFLVRETRPGDQRAHRLRLTRRGLATYRGIVPLARWLQAELEAAIAPEDRRALDRILPRLHAAAAELAAQRPRESSTSRA
jgi:DNA-binding MarR family transcriptional regulator